MSPATRDGTDPNSERPGGDLPPITVPVHGTTRYLRATIAATDGVMTWRAPTTVLGVVPIGEHTIEVPVGDIESIRTVEVGRAPNGLNLVLGILLLATPWFVLRWWVALPIAVGGLWASLVALGPKLEAVTTGGERHRIGVCFQHQLDADLFVEAVTDLASEARPGA